VTCVACFLWLAGCGPRIISGFGDLTAFRGSSTFRTDGPHNGIDLAGNVGDPILAAADGSVISAGELNPGCGIGVRIDHDFRIQTTYCHLSQAKVGVGKVRRGDVIGYLGTTGWRPPPGLEHVHFSVRVAGEVVDPEKLIVGCFDPKQGYPTDRLVLTYPVRCKN
jgi:murein DD-endopeptidase MepM/ murein hydrolase activator NlpD